MKTSLPRLIRLHVGALVAALVVPALYFAYGQYISHYSETQPEKWAADAKAFLTLAAPCAYCIGWAIRWGLTLSARLSSAAILLASATSGALGGLGMVVLAHVQGAPVGISDFTLPVFGAGTFLAPALVFLAIAGPQRPRGAVAA